MNILTGRSSIQIHNCGTYLSERDALTHFIRSTRQKTFPVNPAVIVNLYVSLKSKPMAILMGVPNSYKSEVVRSLAQFLTSGDPTRWQMIKGHAWWAERTGDVSFFVEVQTRYNSAKILAIIEEAWQPVNNNRVFVVCLAHISLAELSGFFSELAFQMQHGRIMHLPYAHLTEPIPYPRNLLLLGTMDTTCFDLPDENLFSQTNLIHWTESETKLATVPHWEATPHGETGFLYSLIRSEGAARLKLYPILGSEQQSLRPLPLVRKLLNEYGIQLSTSLSREILIYLANSWSWEGMGLFDPLTLNNHIIALDFAIVQTLLVRISIQLRDNPTLRTRLQNILVQFPRSIVFLEHLNKDLS